MASVPPQVIHISCDKNQDPPVINVEVLSPLYGGVPFTLSQRQYETLRELLGLPYDPCKEA